MSEQAGRRPGGRGRGSGGRRRPASGGRGGRGPRRDSRDGARPKTSDSAPARAERREEDAPRRERPESVPVPEKDFGKKKTGVVVSTIRRGKFNFGFISFGTAETMDDHSIPRVYFNPSHLGEENLFLRRGYEVTFTVEKDEEGRPIAKDITLTESGKKTREEREAIVAAKRAEREAAGEDNDRPRRPRGEGRRAPRPRRSGVDVNLKVKSGSAEATIKYNTGSSIGRLKAIAAQAVNTDADFSVYYVTPGNPNGEFLTREIADNFKDGDTILLGPKKEDN